MALTATIYRFSIDLSNVDRGVYEKLDLRVACHPSETVPFLLTRVLAYALFYEEGIAFSKGGISSTDEPAITVRGLDGTLNAIVEIGSPSAERIHKSMKAAHRVVVVTQHDPELLIREFQRIRIHRAEELAIYSLSKDFLNDLAATLDRQNDWQLVLSDGELYVTCRGKDVRGSWNTHTLPSE